jgi:hypothetical protein
VILLVVLALVLVVGGITFGLVSYTTTQTNNAHATATAQVYTRQTAVVNATATAQASATATGIEATATTIAANPNPYPPHRGTLTIVDPLDTPGTPFPSGDSCIFTNGAYHVSAPKNYIAFCPTGSSFHNTAVQVDMTVVKGDCGGMFFRYDESSINYYLFQICPDGSFAFGFHFGKTNKFSVLSSGTSPAIKTGLGQINLVAFVANEETYSIYVNKVRINTDTVMQAGGAFSEGEIALCAFSQGNATEVAFKNFKLWVF